MYGMGQLNTLGYAGLTLGMDYSAGYLIDGLSSPPTGKPSPRPDNAWGELSLGQSLPSNQRAEGS